MLCPGFAGTAEAEVVPTTVHDSVARALQVFPQLRAAAGKLQWMVYAGYKQEVCVRVRACVLLLSVLPLVCLCLLCACVPP